MKNMVLEQTSTESFVGRRESPLPLNPLGTFPHDTSNRSPQNRNTLSESADLMLQPQGLRQIDALRPGIATEVRILG